MKKITDFFNKRKRDIISASLINVFFIVAYNLLFYPRFHSDLDILMKSAVYGMAGKVSSYIVFSNIFIGKLLTVLVTLFPGIAWYTVLHYGLVFFSLFIVTYITIKRNPGNVGKIISFVIVAFLAYEGYVEPNYMKTAVFLAVSAAYLLYYAYETKSREKVMGVIVLSVIGSMICFSAFAIAAFVSFGIVILHCLQVKCSKKWKIILATTLGCICGLILAVSLIDYAFYAVAGRDTAIEYRNSMEELYGYGMPNYSDKMLDELDMTHADYVIISHGVSMSDTDADLELVKGVSESDRYISLEKINAFFKEVPLYLFKTEMLYYLMILCAVVFFATDKRNVILQTVVLLICEYCVFYMLDAWTYEWIRFIITLPISLGILIALKNLVIKEKETLIAYLIVLSVILYSKFSSSMVQGVRQNTVEDLIKSASTETVYVVDLVEYLKVGSVFEVYERETIPDNIYIANGMYKIIDEFDEYTYLAAPDGTINYSWLYDASGLQVNDIFID